MAPCPRCGQMNSVRRSACFSCGERLHQQQARQPSAAARRVFFADGVHLLYGSLPRVGAAAQFFRKFYALSEAGFSPVQALSELSRQGPAAFRVAAAEMAAQATAGGLLSEAMRRFPALFLSWQTGLVQAAETGGFLPAALKTIASALEDEYNVRLAITSRAWYLYFLIGLMLLILPLALIFSGEQKASAWTPQDLLSAWALGMRTVSVPIGVGLLAAGLLWQIGSRVPAFRAAQQSVALRLPIFGPFSRTAAMTRFSETLSALWAAGVAPNTAVEAAAAASGNYVIAPRLARVAPALQQGQPAAAALASTGLLEPEMVQLLHVGEVSGSLPETIGRVARYYRSELDNLLRKLPRVVLYLAWAVLLPFALWIWWTLFRTYVRYRFEAPLQEIFNGSQ